MMRVSTLVLVLGLASCAPVSPDVRQSSKKFFGKDFPVDDRANADHLKFDHPYPAVQDSSDFDSDFVNDDNMDGGQWQAQMQYDILRQKLWKAEKELDQRKINLDKQKKQMAEAEKIWKDATVKADKADAAAYDAKMEKTNADSIVSKQEDDVASAAARVEKETNDLEECNKALEDAKKRLKDVLAQKQKAEAEAKQKAEDEAKAKKKGEKEEDAKRTKEEKKQKDMEDRVKKEAESKEEKEERERKEAAEEAAKKKAEFEKQNAAIAKHNKKIAKDVAEMKKDMAADEAAWQKKILEEEAEYVASSKQHDEVMTELQQTELQLEAAAAGLKRYRSAPYVDDNGGVYRVGKGVEDGPKSGAAAWHLSATIVTVLASIAWPH